MSSGVERESSIAASNRWISSIACARVKMTRTLGFAIIGSAFVPVLLGGLGEIGAGSSSLSLS